MNLSFNSGSQLIMYSQKTFRAILDGMARPGKVNRMEAFPVSETGFGGEEAGYLLGLGYTLLDVEVGFHVLDDERFPKGLAAKLAFHSGSAINPLDKADFVFMTGAADPELLSRLKRGTLDFPDTGATAVIQVDRLSEGGPIPTGPATALKLKGPGIMDEKLLVVGGFSERHIQALQTVNGEFPLGIDLILSCGNRFACIPRSVQLHCAG